MISRRSLLVLLVVAVSAMTLFAPVTRADEPVVPGPEQLATLAESGRFDLVLASLKGGSVADRPEVAALSREVEAFQKIREQQDAKRRKAFNTAMERLAKRADAGRLEDALLSAIEAHGLADDPEALLKENRIVDLVTKTKVAVKKAVGDGDWVEALNLYRALDLLFDDHATYRDDLRRAGRHVRLLRVYVPDELERLLKARADRFAKAALDDRDVPADDEKADEGKGGEKGDGKNGDKPRRKSEPWKLEKEDWKQKLGEIETPMMTEALKTVARRHVVSRGYTIVLNGAAEAMMVFSETKALAGAFPKMKDEAVVAQFRQGIEAIKKDVEAQAAGLNAAEGSAKDRAAAAMIDRFFDLNKQTINVPEQVLVYELTEGGIDTLDEFSAVIWPAERDMFRRNFDGEFSGVGIQISMHDDRITVVSPLEDTPAQRAGIKAGDIIATVDGRDTAGWSIDRAVNEITGKEGTPVVLGIARVGRKDLTEFKLVRAKIPIESIRGWEHRQGGGWNYFIDKQAGIGYVRLTQFIPQSADDLDNAINQMERDGKLNALILDLRFNPGGLLQSAVEISNRFIDAGLIVSTVGPPDTRSTTFYARRDRSYRGKIPVVVLVNQGSASASEIVSGALQDYRRAFIIGTRSFGKGSVQDVFPIDNNKAFLKLTTQYYKLPKGRIIHRQPEAKEWGIEPNLKVPMTVDQVADAIEYRQKVDVIRGANEAPDPAGPAPKAADILEKGIDPQLSTALLVLKTRMVSQALGQAAQNGK